MMTWSRLLTIGILGLSLAACGGGGGGDGGEGRANPLQISLDKTSLTFDVFHNIASSGQTVIATATGDYSGALYIGAIIEGQGIEQNVPVSISGTRGEIVISADESLAPGQYTGRVLALVCSDQPCVNRIGGTPLAIAYTVNVRSAVVVGTPGRMYLSATEGGAATSSIVSVTPAGTLTTFSATPRADSPWLQVSDVTATSFRVVAGPRPPGRYIGTIDVSSGPTTSPLVIDFTSVYAPGNSAGLYASPKSVTFNLMPGMQASRNVVVSHYAPSSAQVNYADPDSGSWLTVTGASPYSLNVSSDGLALGSYKAVVHIIGAVAVVGAFEMVEVVLNVGPTLTAAPVTFNIDSNSVTADLDGSSIVQQLGDTAGNWTATTDTPWLTLTRSSGAAGSALEFSISQAQFPSLDNFDTHLGSIQVVSSLGNVQPVDVPVVLNKQIAHVIGLGPQIQVSGRPLRTIVRGRGFTSAGESRMQIAGAAMSDFTIVDDTTATLETSALTVGSYQVSVDNLLGLATSQSALRVIDPVAIPYSVVPAGGLVQSMFIDPLRSTVYSVKARGIEEMGRFRFSGGTWQADIIAVPQLRNANLSNDGSQLLITSGPGRLSYRDANTLVEQQYFEVSEGIRELRYIYGDQGPLTITNDNRVWMATMRSGFDLNWLTRFDPLTGEFTHAPDNATRSYIRSPRLAVSRNGQDLVLDATVNNPSAIPVFRMTATDVGFDPVASNRTPNCHGVLSDHAERIACGELVYEPALLRSLDTRIFDSSMQPLARLQINAIDRSVGWRIIGPVLFSPDGGKAYAYSINSHDFAFMPAPAPAMPTNPPRVYVFDVSSDTPTTEIESSDYFAFGTLHYPGCREFELNTCDAFAKGAIAPDGQTLYFVGDVNFISLPIPIQHR